MGRHVRIRLPSNDSDKTRSEQDIVRGGNSRDDSPSVAESRVVPRSVKPNSRLSPNDAAVQAPIESNLQPSKVPLLPGMPQPSRLAIIAGAVEERGFSREVSERISVPQKQSTIRLYEAKWKIFGDWCRTQGLDPCTPSIPVVADFLLYCFTERKLSMSAIKGYRSALTHIMSTFGLDISNNADIRALISNFTRERPISHRVLPRWDISVVLRYLMKPPFEPMKMASLADLTRKTAFLVMLASAKRNSELWAFSANVTYGTDAGTVTLKFLPGFIAKTHMPGRPETELRPVTFPALAPSVSYDSPERNLCPVRALRYYLSRTKAGTDPNRPNRLFVAHKVGHVGDISKMTISGWIKAIIREAYKAVEDEDIPHLVYDNFQAREVRAIATSLAFHQHTSITQVMEAAAWRSQSTFASFYFRDMSCTDNLGEIVAGQTVVATH